MKTAVYSDDDNNNNDDNDDDEEEDVYTPMREASHVVS